MNEDKGIQGFKKSEFATATPERVFNGADVRTEDLPAGVRLYLREKAIDLGTKKVLVNVYRLLDDGGLKNKRVWVGKMKMNRKPEDEEVAEQFGGGSFIWILKWSGPDGQECGIISETIEIDEELGRAAHDAWMRRQGNADSTPAGLPVAAPAASAPGALTIDGVLKIMAATEEKTLATMERIMAMANGNKAETPSEVLKGAYQGASEMMSKAVETNFQMVNSMRKVQQERITREAAADLDEEIPIDSGDDGESKGPEVPSFLQPFMPLLEKGLERLLKGGPVAAITKELILSDDDWKTIFKDKDKWGQLVSFMEREYGSEKTGRALDLLLNRRDPVSKGNQKKGKGK